MAAEFDTSSLGGYIGTAVATMITAILGTKEYMSRKRVGDAADDSTVKGYKGNDTVLDNLVKEVKRLTEDQAEMREEIDELKKDSAETKVLAIDCYALVSECDCAHDNKALLLKHLLTIIRKDKSAAKEAEL